MMRRTGVLVGLLIALAMRVSGQTVISNVYVSATTSTTATIVWTTSTPATSLIRYGYNNTLPYQNNTNYTLVTSHSMTLTVLNASQPYFFAVVSVDGGGLTTQSPTFQFALCNSNENEVGPPSTGTVPVTGTVNFSYGNGTYTLNWNPPSGAVATPTVCGHTVATTVTGTLNTSGSFNSQVADSLKVTPGPGTWTVHVADPGNIAPISTTQALSVANQDVSAPLQAAAAAPGLVQVTATATECNPSWVCVGSAGGGVNPGANYALPQYSLASGRIVGPSNLFLDTLSGNNLIVGSGSLGSVSSAKIGGSLYAKVFQTGGGNNGIANAAASNQTVIADPSYSSTEQYSATSPIPNWPSAFLFQDLRGGKFGNLFHDWGYTNNLYGDPSNPAALIYGVMDGTYTSTQTTHQNGLDIYLGSTTPGFSKGFPAFGGQGWQVTNSLQVQQVINGSGIAETMNSTLFKYGVGDSVSAYFYLFNVGGQTAPADEGTKAISVSANEQLAVFTGTCLTGCTNGSTALKLTVVTAAGQQGTNRYIVNTTQSPSVNTVSGPVVTGLTSLMSAVPVTTAVTASTAWGTLNNNVPTPNNPQPPFTTSEIVAVTIVGGTSGASSSFTTGLACFSSMYHDQANITSASAPIAGVQTLTVAAHTQHAAGSYIFQGGACGQSLEFTAYTQVISGVSYRYLFDVVGSTDTHTLQVLAWRNGASLALSNVSNLNTANMYSCFNTGALSNGGTTTVSFTFGSFCANGLGGPNQYAGSTFYITNATDAAFNGNCTNATFTAGSNSGTCTESGLSGTHTATSSTFQLSKVGLNGLGVINLRPMAAVLDVQNEATLPPSMDGTLAIEPNNMVNSLGDTIEETHHESEQMNSAVFYNQPINPFNNGNGVAFGVYQNFGGGGASQISPAIVSLFNGVPATTYIGLGGIQTPGNIMNINSYYTMGFNFNFAPSSNGALIYLNPQLAQKNNLNFCYPLMQILHSSGQLLFQDCPNSGNETISTGGNFLLNPTGTATYTASSHIFNGPETHNGNVNLFGPVNNISNANLGTTGNFISGQGLNYAPYSNNLLGATWVTAAGAGTTTCTIQDDQGAPACTLTVTGSTYDWQDNNTTGYTFLTLNASYVAQARMKGSVGNELIGLGGDFLGGNVRLTTSWAPYCVVFTATNSGAGLGHLAAINLQAPGVVIYASDVVTAPGNSCPPFLTPVTTTNNQVLTVTSINHAPTLDAYSYTLGGTAMSMPGGLPVIIDQGTVVMTTAAITGPACGSTVTVVSANILATDSISWSFNAAPDPTDSGLVSWPTAGNVNFAYCLPLGASETPVAATINWKVVR